MPRSPDTAELGSGTGRFAAVGPDGSEAPTSGKCWYSIWLSADTQSKISSMACLVALPRSSSVHDRWQSSGSSAAKDGSRVVSASTCSSPSRANSANIRVGSLRKRKTPGCGRKRICQPAPEARKSGRPARDPDGATAGEAPPGGDGGTVVEFAGSDALADDGTGDAAVADDGMGDAAVADDGMGRAMPGTTEPATGEGDASNWANSSLIAATRGASTGVPACVATSMARRQSTDCSNNWMASWVTPRVPCRISSSRVSTP